MSKETISPEQFRDSLIRLLNATVNKKDKGIPNGVADLDRNGLIPLSRLPDDAITKIWEGNGNPPTGTEHTMAIDYDTGYLYYKDEFGSWKKIAGGGGGSSGGDSSTITLNPEWQEKTLSYGDDCILNFNWSSVFGGNTTGMGTFSLYVTTAEGEEKKESYRITQGSHSINLTSYLALGDTEIIIRITDRYNNMAQAILSIKTVKLSMTESFDEAKVYTSNFNYYCTPSGAKGKTKNMYVELDSDTVINGAATTDDGILQSYPMSVNAHGVHSIRAYFTCELNEGAEPIRSEEVYSEFAYVVKGETTPIITTDCGVNQLEEFDSVNVGWYVFTPNEDGSTAGYTPRVEIYESNQTEIPSGATPVKVLENVPYGAKQEHIFKAENIGTNYILFKVGDIVRPVLMNVTKSSIDVSAVTSNLQLYLTPRNHTNNDTNKDVWVSETVEGRVEATLENFNFRSDGWVTDASGKSTVLRLMDEARLHIPVGVFTDAVQDTGLVIEFEIATHDVLDYEAEIIRCMNSGIGISVSANQATLSTANNTLTTPFREGEQVRVTFVIESDETATKLLLIYINGVLSGAKSYTGGDNFAQSVVQGITVGSNLCTTDIYAVRIYSTALGRNDILNNWIADTQDRELLLSRYKRNDIFDDVGISVEQLPEGLPYIVFFAKEDDLPDAKGIKKYVNGKYVDPDEKRCFTFSNAQIKVQGTSSSGYPRKNFTLTFDDVEGIMLNGIKAYDFQINESSLPTNSFCFKADYASSEGANNVELVKLFNDICPVKTPPQLEDERVRQGIDGFPMVVFCYYDNAYYFIGKYNFNNDKSTPEIFGMVNGVESWEVTDNGTAIGEYREDDFDTLVYDKNSDTWSEKWLNTFEARYPEDYTGYKKLQEMVSWVKSTNRWDADEKRKLSEAVTYGDKTYEYDSKEYRKAKFINEASEYFDVQHLCFFYLFTAFFLMIDNREKNTFPTRYLDGLWYFLPYDFDSAIGINNSGELVFGHGLEDIDEGVYNGKDSVLWCNVRDYFADEIETMYISLRSNGLLTYDDVVRRFTDHQRLWGEAIFNEDSYYKYIAVMLGEEGTTRYLAMLQGSKEAQRNYWLYNRFRYFDSKYVTGDAYDSRIIIRPNVNADIVITPYTDTYLAINFDRLTGEYKPIPQRAFKGVPVAFSNPKAEAQNAVVHIYNASQITDLGDLSTQLTSEFDGKSAVRLQRLVLGSDNIINDKFDNLSLGSNKLLKLLNVKNCPTLSGIIDVSGCSGIEEAYFEGTSITKLTLPTGGSLRVLHLPETITDLTVIEHKVTDFSMPNYNNLSTLWLELNETSKNTFDLKSIIRPMLERFKASEEGELGRLRVTGFELTGDNAFDTAQEILDFYKDIRTYFRGLDANGNASQDETYLQNMLVGKIKVKESPILGTQLEEMRVLFPYVKIDYDKVQSTIFFYHDEEGYNRLYNSQIIEDNGNARDPVPIVGKPPTYYAPTTTNNGGTEDNTYRYVFTGWSGSLENVNTLRRLNAVYRHDLKYYRSFIDRGNYVPVNGKDQNVYYALSGENNVIEPANPSSYLTEENGISYQHDFLGWAEKGTGNYSSQVPNIKAGDKTNIVYESVYDKKQVYIVKYLDEATEIGRAAYFYGDRVTKPSNPTKNHDWRNTYTFSHWELENGTEVTNFNDIIVTGDMNIYAIFDATEIDYIVRFRKHYGSVLQTLSGTYHYGTTYDEYYTGATSWSYTSPKNREETLKGWRVRPSLSSGTFYLDYVTILDVVEEVALAVRNSNPGLYNTGEVGYVCDDDFSTERGFNIGVRNILQVHHQIRLNMTFAHTLPDTTTFKNVSVSVSRRCEGYRDGITHYACRMKCYFQHYIGDGDYTNISGASAADFLIDNEIIETKYVLMIINGSTLSQALSWMTKNVSEVNNKNTPLIIMGSNLYVREIDITMYYTT